VVGFALYGLPVFYDFFVQDLGWTRQQVTAGNSLSKVVVGPVFGFLAGSIIDLCGVRRLMLAGIVMAGLALVGLSGVTTLAGFYLFYFLNALGYVCGGAPRPGPADALVQRRQGRRWASYPGIGVGGALVPILAHALVVTSVARALRYLGILMIVVAFPPAFFVREPPKLQATDDPDMRRRRSAQSSNAARSGCWPSAMTPSRHRGTRRT
jgi:sugar phosphate permease